MPSWDAGSIGGASVHSVFDCHHGCFSPDHSLSSCHQRTHEHHCNQPKFLFNDDIQANSTVESLPKVSVIGDFDYLEGSHCSASGQKYLVKTKDVKL